MDGLEMLGAEDVVGFDYSALLKGAGGLVSGVAEGFGDKKTTPEPPKPPPPSNAWKYALVGVAGIGMVGLLIILGTRKSAAVAVAK